MYTIYKFAAPYETFDAGDDLVALSVNTEKHSANANTPIFMAHGTYDPVVILDRAQASYAMLGKMGYQVDWNEYPMEHSVNHEELMDISRFLQEVLVTK